MISVIPAKLPAGRRFLLSQREKKEMIQAWVAGTYATELEGS